MNAADIDLLIVATMTADLPMPAAACIIRHKLGLPDAAACFDLNAACSGFIYALDTGCALLTSGRYQRALVIGVEKMSAVVDWKDRTTCVLFGDGAGRGRHRGRSGARPRAGRDQARHGWRQRRPAPHPRRRAATAPLRRNPSPPARHFIKMKGREVYKAAVRVMDEAARDILEQHGLSANQIGLVIPHQANLRIIESIAQYLELPLERFFVNVDRYGNTSAASIPIALDEARRAGRIQPGDLTLLVAFGAGLTYGSALIRW